MSISDGIGMPSTIFLYRICARNGAIVNPLVPNPFRKNNRGFSRKLPNNGFLSNVVGRIPAEWPTTSNGQSIIDFSLDKISFFPSIVGSGEKSPGLKVLPTLYKESPNGII